MTAVLVGPDRTRQVLEKLIGTLSAEFRADVLCFVVRSTWCGESNPH
jgi:hypothetical protein